MPHKPSIPYERKFAQFLKLCADAKAQQIDVVSIPSPQTLGDTYQELILSLDRLATAELMLRILPPTQR